MPFALEYTGRFQKDLRLAVRRGKDIAKLKAVMRDLLNETPLPASRRDHPLVGNWNGRRECHLEGDWILIYKKKKGKIIFERTGTHADLF